ncbi:MAG: nitronate monooxygenase, partial [Caulobacterales bacterium]|nr:nitronate monooxygenase [Caulobacterales bacterium]
MMNSPICRMLGIEFPLLAFSHCRDVVAAVSKAGGMGVFGAVALPPDRLEEELAWIDDHVQGKPYGVDLIVPNKVEGKGERMTAETMLERLPGEHKDFAAKLLADHGIDPTDLDDRRQSYVSFSENLRGVGTYPMLDVAFRHPIKLIANALGVPPQIMLDMGREHGVAVAALVGAKEHALAQVGAGVDILVVSGGEAGGHCGEVSTMVLIPEVCRALEELGADTPVLAAGGIATGAQMAGAMAMGAAGAWCGSVWLTTSEAETNPVVKDKMLAASSRDTVRSRSRTGKPSRQLQSPWTTAWEGDGAPTPLPMPLQS